MGEEIYVLRCSANFDPLFCLAGAIPPALGALGKLRKLELFRNQLTGTSFIGWRCPSMESFEDHLKPQPEHKEMNAS